MRRAIIVGSPETLWIIPLNKSPQFNCLTQSVEGQCGWGEGALNRCFEETTARLRPCRRAGTPTRELFDRDSVPSRLHAVAPGGLARRPSATGHRSAAASRLPRRPPELSPDSRPEPDTTS